MSQVIVTNDNLNKLRSASKVQEDHISREDAYAKWRLPNVQRLRPLAMFIGLVSLPIVAFWGLLLALVGAGVTLFTLILKILSIGMRSHKTSKARQ